MSSKRLFAIFSAVVVGLMLLSGPVLASGLSKPSPVGARAIGMGGAFVAVADDPMAIYWNPAGLTQLKGHHITGGIDSTIPGLTYKPYTAADPTGQATLDEKAETSFLVAPSFGASTDIAGPVILGLGVYLPYANGGKFPTASQAAGNPLDGMIYSLEIAPALAFALPAKISLGFTFRANYIKDELNGQFLVPGVFPPPFAGNFGNLKTTGWGFGGSAGLLAGPYKGVRFGVAYRSQIKSKPSGNFDLTDGAGNVLATSNASVTLTFPNQVRFGVAWDINPKALVAIGVDWEQNSQVQTFDVTIENPAGNDFWQQLPALWDDSWTIHLGTEYKFTKSWIGRFGYAYDMSSIPDPTNNRITGDVNAHEIALGGSYEASFWAIDLAYDFRFGDRTIPFGLDASTGLPNQAPGEYFGYVSSLSLMGRFFF